MSRVRSENLHTPSDPGRRRMLKRLLALGALAAVDVTALSSCTRRVVSRAGERNVIVLGLDGLDAGLVERWLAEGKLPNLRRLRQLGGYRRLTSSIPPQSPVAWATFITGTNPGKHGIIDFIARDPKTYLPYLSIARTTAGARALSLGPYKLPLSSAKVECLREGPTFWELLEAQGLPCSVYRMPTNFPTGNSGAKELAGLGAPDLRGTYGEFSYYTDDPPPNAKDVSGGTVYPVTISNGHARASLTGPENTLREKSPASSAEFDIWLDAEHKLAKIDVQGHAVLLRQGEWSDWVPVRFDMLPHLKSVGGICRFYLKEAAPHFRLYVTPVNVDPLDPALPVTSPAEFGTELAETFGRYYTMGFPEDVKALRHNILDDGEYLHQTGITVEEARRMYERALQTHSRGLLFYYFSVTDRTQHMFWRTMDPRHPAYDPRLVRDYGNAIEACYREADELVGEAIAAAGKDTTLLVMSDHGFAPFYRSFNLNTWLVQSGYLAGTQPWQGKMDIFTYADWANSAAYGVGFNSLYLNVRGREAQGRVEPGERADLLRRIAADLEQVRDPKTGERVVEQAYVASESYSHDQLARTPDIVIGYARGYRGSDDSVLGDVTEHLFEDNTDKWSGDHCVDRSVVPGVLFTNKPVRVPSPALADVTASVLAEFGLPVPKHMEGKPIW